MKLSDHQQQHQKTGRTARMIAEAYRQSDKLGMSVLIVVHNQDYADTLQRRINTAHPGSRIKVVATVPPGFDWERMTPPCQYGADRRNMNNNVWFVDHAVIERDPKFNAMFEALTQFNQPAPEQ